MLCFGIMSFFLRNNTDFDLTIVPNECILGGTLIMEVPMKKMETTRKMAERWNLTERRVSELCNNGTIRGAVKEGRSWRIPANTKKPADRRIRSGTYRKQDVQPNLPIPIGVSDYRLASTEYYYIDKTLLIRDILDERPLVSLFTRPRRFGKTLNMDMLRTFFERSEDDTSVYFRNRKIWKCGKKYQEYQGKYPVIFVSFKDVKCLTWEETYNNIRNLLQHEFERHLELLKSSKLNSYDKKKMKSILDGEANSAEIEASFSMLSELLHKHYGIAPIIIVDEYDTPIHQGYVRGFYDSVIHFMRNLFSGGFKDNSHLTFGFLTGILKVAKESIFSGLNNPKINTILDNRYSEYFGFTHEEVKTMAHYYHADDKYQEICEWYDGYHFGNADIFNPWSVINYFGNECQPRAYWQSTGSNSVVGEILSTADNSVYDKLNLLIQGKTITSYIDTSVIYPQIRDNSSSIYSFLLVAGYLRIVKSEQSFNGDFICELALPNKEITFVYNKEILQRLNTVFPQSTAIAIQEALYSGDTPKLESALRNLLLVSVSSFDTAHENFYHGLVLGLCAIMDNRYEVSSNREVGDGRYDICLSPKSDNNNLPGILIELKAAQKSTQAQLKKMAGEALKQINDKRYDTILKTRKQVSILKYGVAFCGKAVEIEMER